MKPLRPLHRSAALFAVASAIAACQGPAATDTATTPAAQATQAAPQAPAAQAPAAPTVPAVVPVVPEVPKPRVVQLVPTPKDASRQLIGRFWSYGQDAPYEITTFSAVGGLKNPENGHPQVKFGADVRLPMVGPLKAMRVLQAPPVVLCEVAPDPLSDMSSATLPPGVDGSAIDQKSLEQTAKLPPLAEAPKALSEPHHVTGVADNGPWMSNATEIYTVTDQYTGEVLRIEHDQEWTRFAFVAGKDRVELDFNPDGTYLVNDKPASTLRDAVTLLEASPVVANASPYSLAMIAARIGRLQPAGSRGVPTCNPPTGMDAGHADRTKYRTLSAESTDPHARAYVIANAVLKDLLTGAVAPAAPAR